jgi:hypothetical protein
MIRYAPGMILLAQIYSPISFSDQAVRQFCQVMSGCVVRSHAKAGRRPHAIADMQVTTVGRIQLPNRLLCTWNSLYALGMGSCSEATYFSDRFRNAIMASRLISFQREGSFGIPRVTAWSLGARRSISKGLGCWGDDQIRFSTILSSQLIHRRCVPFPVRSATIHGATVRITIFLTYSRVMADIDFNWV